MSCCHNVLSHLHNFERLARPLFSIPCAPLISSITFQTEGTQTVSEPKIQVDLKKVRVNVFLIFALDNYYSSVDIHASVENGVWKQYLENSSVCRPFCAVVTFNIVPWVNTNS